MSRFGRAKTVAPKPDSEETTKQQFEATKLPDTPLTARMTVLSSLKTILNQKWMFRIKERRSGRCRRDWQNLEDVTISPGTINRPVTEKNLLSKTLRYIPDVIAIKCVSQLLDRAVR